MKLKLSSCGKRIKVNLSNDVMDRLIKYYEIQKNIKNEGIDDIIYHAITSYCNTNEQVIKTLHLEQLREGVEKHKEQIKTLEKQLEEYERNNHGTK